MKKHFLKYFIFIIFIFLIVPISVEASFGDLRYEITNASIGNNSITFKGWAFIHRTNNYNTVKYNGREIANNGGQKILIRAVNLTNGKVVDTKVVSGSSDSKNYNFYCELFDTVNGRKCSEVNYAALSGKQITNQCTNGDDGNGNSSSSSYCYYEDIAFSITFNNVENWNVNDSDKISFQIAVSNNDFENKLSNTVYGKRNYNEGKYYQYNNDIYTLPENIYLSESIFAGSKYETDFVVVDKSTFVESVAVIAKNSMLRYYTNDNRLVYFKGNMFDHHVYSTYPVGAGFYQCSSNVFLLADTISGYTGGISDNTEQGLCKYFLGGNCSGSHNYAIYVENINKWYVCPSKTKSGFVAIVRGSHVKVSGDTVFQISIKNKKLCEVTDPDKNNGLLQCNEGKTYNSTCEELTVSTSKGSARVKIEQIGNVSSVLTPESLYAGGGFKFGIIYYNTIKWSYVSGQNIDNNLHIAVVDAMNKKIKDFDSYVAGINISNLQIGGKTFNMVKQCTTSNKNKDYYDKELIVSCIFTIPSSTIDKVGNVSYNYSNGVNIENKYYTPMNYNGNYKITADIVGMDRITDNAAKNDSKKGTKWTGDWSDTFTNCQINLYTLISGIPKFIYRPIDINNPFPNRNAGINWFDWYNITRNKERLENTYSNLDYTAILDNNAISDIKNYNKMHNYLEWDSINEVTNESSFITEKNYMVRGGN